VCVCDAQQRERSRSPLNLVVSPSSRRSTDSVDGAGSPAAAGDGLPGGGGVSTAAAGAVGTVPPGGPSSTKARLLDFFGVTDTSAGALEVSRSKLKRFRFTSFENCWNNVMLSVVYGHFGPKTFRQSFTLIYLFKKGYFIDDL